MLTGAPSTEGAPTLGAQPSDHPTVPGGDLQNGWNHETVVAVKAAADHFLAAGLGFLAECHYRVAWRLAVMPVAVDLAFLELLVGLGYVSNDDAALLRRFVVARGPAPLVAEEADLRNDGAPLYRRMTEANIWS